MTNEQKTLLDLLKKALFSREITPDDSTDWNAVFEEAKAQAVFLLAYQAADKSAVPGEVMTKWKNHAGASLINNIRVIRNHVLIDDWMTKAGIPYVILKGCASSSYYPAPSYRTMGDVDFLVPKEHIDAAKALLEGKGLTPNDNGHPAHVEYLDRSGVFELHFSLNGIPENSTGKKIWELLGTIHADAERKSIEYGNAFLPSPFHHGLVMLVHNCSHMTSEGIGLRHLCDWAVFVNSFTEEGFVDAFEKKLRWIGLWKFAQTLTLASIKYLGADDKRFAHDCDESAADGIMEDILSGGNFGRKDGNRSEQGALITSKGQLEIDENRGAFSQYLKTKTELVKRRWPSAKRNKLLIPIGFAYFGAARVIGLVSGKRKRQFTQEIVEGAAERKKLYSKLELFREE